MYWIDTPNGKRLPLDLAHVDSVAPTTTTDGRGTAHWASCPNADHHRKPRTASAA
jgi:hypothetical protein